MADHKMEQHQKLFPIQEIDSEDPIRILQRDYIRMVVENLPEPHRSVVEMRIWKQWTFQQIADVLGMDGRQHAYDYYQRAIGWLEQPLHDAKEWHLEAPE